MSAYLLVDIDDLREYLEAQKSSVSMSDIALLLRNTAALAAGLSSPEQLTAIAVANWNLYRRTTYNGVNIQQAFAGAHYDLFNVAERRFMTEALLTDYFPLDSEGAITELILVSSRADFTRLLERLNLPPMARVRIWADTQPIVKSKPVLFQPMESILGVKTKSVALYVDFENISISLNEQSYIVDVDLLVQALKTKAGQYGQVVHMAAYAPWGQRGSLPPMLDSLGREVSEDIPSRLALESIDPVFSLPGKNSADLRIAKDVLADSTQSNSAEIFIIASGDRDFNDIYNTLRARGKQVVVWGVRGSTSRVLENNTSIRLEYIDDFAGFRRHQDLMQIYDESQEEADEDELEFLPSQWSSVVLQYDLLRASLPAEVPVSRERLAEQLVKTNNAANRERAEDLLQQALNIGILVESIRDESLSLRPNHPIVSQTRRIRDHVVLRVSNTLQVREWDYVNYGFLLKGIAMDEKLKGMGINTDDNWRSEWVDYLVREGLLERELIPHRHNPSDLVPVIRVASNIPIPDAYPTQLSPSDSDIDNMMVRVIVSVEQFTSFRKFVWCPLGSLHKRLRPYDEGTVFQEAIERMMLEGAVKIDEYPNPQSQFTTKGISLVLESPRVSQILEERNRLIHLLLEMYNAQTPITKELLRQRSGLSEARIDLWVSIMELENVLNPIYRQPNHYSLFRNHHTVCQVAGDPSPVS